MKDEKALWRVNGNEWRVARVKSGGMLADPLREALCEHQEESAVIDTPLQKGA